MVKYLYHLPCGTVIHQLEDDDADISCDFTARRGDLAVVIAHTVNGWCETVFLSLTQGEIYHVCYGYESNYAAMCSVEVYKP